MLPIRVALVPLLCLVACGDDECLPGPIADSQATITTSLDTATPSWNNWRSSPNNDCGETGGPISLTVEADQVGIPERAITLCLPRPDKLSATPVDITDTSRVRIIDIFAEPAPDCLASLDRSTPATGTVAFPGICGDGDGPEGYSIDFDISVPMTITCGADVNTALLVFDSTASVTATQLP
jgi:hypothetical protein